MTRAISEVFPQQDLITKFLPGLRPNIKRYRGIREGAILTPTHSKTSPNQWKTQDTAHRALLDYQVSGVNGQKKSNRQFMAAREHRADESSVFCQTPERFPHSDSINAVGTFEIFNDSVASSGVRRPLNTDRAVHQNRDSGRKGGSAVDVSADATYRSALEE